MQYQPNPRCVLSTNNPQSDLSVKLENEITAESHHCHVSISLGQTCMVRHNASPFGHAQKAIMQIKSVFPYAVCRVW